MVQLSLPKSSGHPVRPPFSELVRQGEDLLAPLKTFGLFAGIGGIESGLERAGHVTTGLCEIDEAAVAVLEKHFPGVPLHRDIAELKSMPRDTDLIAAGFPCQDLSQAGQTAGINGARSGLVGHVFRLVDKRRVPWILIENVPFMMQLGRGRALELIVGELERLGYRWAYRVVDTLAFGLPQRRERVFLLASRTADPRAVLFVDDVGEVPLRRPSRRRSFGFYWTEGLRGLGSAIDAVPPLKGGSSVGIPSPPAILLPSGRVGTPEVRDAERLQGFEPDWTIAAQAGQRRIGHRWKLVGNAVTTNVAEWIGFRLRSPGHYDSSWDTKLPRGSRWPDSAWGDGSQRYSVAVSRWPFAVEGRPIHKFLEFERRDLSARATRGFLSRLGAGSLNPPEWFESVLKKHLDRVERRGT